VIDRSVERLPCASVCSDRSRMVRREDGIAQDSLVIVPIATRAGPACVPVPGPVGPRPAAAEAQPGGADQAERTGRPAGGASDSYRYRFVPSWLPLRPGPECATIPPPPWRTVARDGACSSGRAIRGP
jgi:hypothetical protein